MRDIYGVESNVRDGYIEEELECARIPILSDPATTEKFGSLHDWRFLRRCTYWQADTDGPRLPDSIVEVLAEYLGNTKRWLEPDGKRCYLYSLEALGFFASAIKLAHILDCTFPLGKKGD